MLALDSIRKASKWEPNEQYKPRYLSLQSELEIGLDEIIEARNTLSTAKQLIEKYMDFWVAEAHKDIVKRIDAAIDDLEQRET